MNSSRLINLCDLHGDFVKGDDGFVVFWPIGNNGGFRSNDLRSIAAELDKRNREWAAKLNADASVTAGLTDTRPAPR
jgi:hypothetical protein